VQPHGALCNRTGNLEAMKMGNVIIAPFDCQISEVWVKLKESVQGCELLFVLEKINID